MLLTFWILDRSAPRTASIFPADGRSFLVFESYAGQFLVAYGRLPDGIIDKDSTNFEGPGYRRGPNLKWKSAGDPLTRWVMVPLIKSDGHYGHYWPYSVDGSVFASWPFRRGYIHLAHGSAQVSEWSPVKDRVTWFQLILPQWVVFVLLGLIPGTFMVRPTVAGIKARLRGKVGVCRKCGYDLRATPDKCPECGTEVLAGSHQISGQ